MLSVSCHCGAAADIPEGANDASLFRQFLEAHESCREAYAKDMERPRITTTSTPTPSDPAGPEGLDYGNLEVQHGQ
jgi:hypothetical protein